MALPIYRAPLIKQGWLRALAFFVVYFVAVIITAVTIGFISGITAAKNADKGGLSLALMATLTLFGIAALSILLVFLFRIIIDRRSFNSIGLTWKGFQQDAWVGLLLGPALLGIGSLVLYFSGTLRWTDITFNGSDFFLSVILLVLIAIGEELVFRGYVLNNLMESMNKWLAFGITTLLFAISHIDNPHVNIIAVLNVLLGGAMLGINYIYTRNLWFAILFHFSWNFFQGPILGYKVSGIEFQSILQMELTGNPLLTGGPFGFEGSIINTALSLIALLLLYVLHERNYKAAPIARPL